MSAPYYVGEHYQTGTIILRALNYSGITLTQPTTSYKITIIDPAGVTKIDDTAMDRDEDGDYHYDYEPAATELTGKWTGFTKMTSSTRDTVQPFYFTLKSADGSKG